MSSKPSYLALEDKVKALEAELALRDQEGRITQGAHQHQENGLAPGISELEEANQRLEQELAASRMNYKALQQDYGMLETLINTIEGEAFIKDAEGTYLFVNRAFGKDFEVDPDQVIGKDDYFVFPPEAAALLQKNDKEIMAAKKAVDIEESAILKGKQVTYLTNKVPLMGDDGKVVGICGVGFDITRQKQMEMALKEAQRNLEARVKERTAELSRTVDKLGEAELRYRTVADFTYDWEYWTNLDGNLEYISPSCERISGYTPQEFMENPSLYRDIIAPEDQELWKHHYHGARREPKAREIQFRIENRNGSVHWIEHACQPVWGDKAELLGFRASNRDITRRKEGELALQKAYSEIKALKAELEADRTYLQEEIKLSHDHENIIGESDVLKYVLFRSEQIAPTDSTVLIQGETGTGKELIARAIHSASRRSDRPLIKVDCASLPVNLIESELFGHEKGAFTTAVEKRVGRFELANGATIFLDEIGELPLDLQPKLLRVLQDGEFERLGNSRTLQTDVRVIAATNRDLETDVNKKRFRMDLWYRLNVFTISLPPLRERSEDIGLLVNYMVGNFERKHGKRIRSVPTKVITRLQHHTWPGNIRELENVIERAVIHTRGDTLQLDTVVERAQSSPSTVPDHPIKSLWEVERYHIIMALKKTNWQIHGRGGAAALLDINPSTLRGRMRKQGIQRPARKDR